MQGSRRKRRHSVIAVLIIPVVALAVATADLAPRLVDTWRERSVFDGLNDFGLGDHDRSIHRLRGKSLMSPADASAANGTPPVSAETAALIRTIPQSSLDLVASAEGMGSKGLYDFNRTKDGSHLMLTFGALSSFTYILPSPEALRESSSPETLLGNQIPEPIAKLDREDAVFVGFMVPIDVDERGRIRQFALTQNQMFCCYGIAPELNEWVMVTMADGNGTEYVADLPVAVLGEFEVGEDIDDGYIMSLYRMNGRKVVDVQHILK